jgi:hypothetical protein
VIIYNEFKEFQQEVEFIDAKMYFANLEIYRDNENGIPRNENGKIYIPNVEDKYIFMGNLTHEVGHTVYDPITFHNYFKCVCRIVKELGLDVDKSYFLANVASDILLDFMIAKDKDLSLIQKIYLERRFKGNEKQLDPVKLELLGIYKKLFNADLDVQSKYFSKIKTIVYSSKTREQKYVEIAKLFIDLLEEEQEEGEKEGKGKDDMPIDMPVRISDDQEIEKEVEQIFKESQDFIDAEEKIEILSKLLKKDLSSYIDLSKFYEAQANKVTMSIVFPERRDNLGIKIGSKKWIPSYGVDEINVKKTFYKFGVNIPYATTQSDRILKKFISSNKDTKPVDIVVSIDSSSSTGSPSGSLSYVADYEIIMFYALINLAKRNNQRIGLTIWSDEIEYTTLPKMYEWKEADKLKKEILDNWRGWQTVIRLALEQANQYKDKLFFIFTDGEVAPEDLIDADNVIFFLVTPKGGYYDLFTKKYGAYRVIKIDNLEDIPKITLKHYIKIFGGQ